MGVEVELEDLSRKEPIARLTKANISAKSKDSAPRSGDDKSHLLISDEEESMSDDSLNSESSSGSSVESSEESEDGKGSG